MRDRNAGKSKGFCLVCYEDQRSIVVAVANFNGIKIKGKTILVDHVSYYRPLGPQGMWMTELWEKGYGLSPSSSSSAEGSEDEASSLHHKQGKQKRSKTREKTAAQVKDEEGQTGAAIVPAGQRPDLNREHFRLQ